MIRHVDYDANETTNTRACLPEVIDRLSIDYDGGHLVIYVNGDVFHNVSTGTRDCSISIDREDY